jgi:hypothetical protein
MAEATPERTTLQPRVGYVDKPAGDRTGQAPRLPLEGSDVDFTVAGQCRIFTDFAAGTSLKRTQAPSPYQFASLRIGRPHIHTKMRSDSVSNVRSCDIARFE